MLDLKLIRENPELVKKGVENKNEKSTVDQVLELDKERRNLIESAKE